MEISLRDISGITTKQLAKRLRLKWRTCKGISDAILHTFVACEKALYARK